MTAPEQWRFQWPDGTWIRWNPDTEAWEKEIPDADGEPRAAEPIDIAPEERWLLDNLEPPSAPEPEAEPGAVSPSIDVGPGSAFSGPDRAESVDDEDYEDYEDYEDDASDDEDAEEQSEVALGPRRSAAHVISTEADEPKGSLRSTIVAGAGIGLAVGIIVTMMLR